METACAVDLPEVEGEIQPSRQVAKSRREQPGSLDCENALSRTLRERRKLPVKRSETGGEFTVTVQRVRAGSWQISCLVKIKVKPRNSHLAPSSKPPQI
jgi:hypothetical protein